MEFHSCVSFSGQYGSPTGVIPEPFDQMTQLQFSSGEQRQIPAYDVVKSTDDFRLAVVVDRYETPFDVIAAMPTGAAKKLKNPERTRSAAKEANDQFKNAIKYQAAPCLLMIYHDGLDVPDETVIKSAFYGNLKYTASKGSPADGKLILDKDGAWNRDKNRTTSAAMYIRNGGEPFVIHNYWADRPLRAGLFVCKEVSAMRNGTFMEVYFSPKLTAIRLIDRLDRIGFRARQLIRVMAARLRRSIRVISH